MQSLYFFAFCAMIAFVIYWCFRNDDADQYDDEALQTGNPEDDENKS